uniref:UPAR/Ly6 domain-containing protein n=1 Tax=Salvator merianae TaxID=96440 RepID=A0A8D0BLG9_SALMN
MARRKPPPLPLLPPPPSHTSRVPPLPQSPFILRAREEALPDRRRLIWEWVEIGNAAAEMKASFAVFLAALLCVGQVSTLMCFHCENAESNWDCLSMKSCDDTDKYCFTKYFGGGVGDKHKQAISKGCSSTCPEGSFDLGLVAFSMKCCDTHLCNTSGAGSVKSSSLILAVGTVATLLCAFWNKL